MPAMFSRPWARPIKKQTAPQRDIDSVVVRPEFLICYMHSPLINFEQSLVWSESMCPSFHQYIPPQHHNFEFPFLPMSFYLNFSQHKRFQLILSFPWPYPHQGPKQSAWKAFSDLLVAADIMPWIITKKVLVFIPPPVDPGDAPININTVSTSSPAVENVPSG